MHDTGEAIRLDPKAFRPYVQRAEIWKAKGEFDVALRDANEAIKLGPNNSEGLITRAAISSEKRDYDRALADLGDALRLDPRSVSAYNNRGLIWQWLGEFDRALADFGEAIRLDPLPFRSFANRGEVWRLKGDLDRALADLDELVRLHTVPGIGHLRRGDLYRYKGEFQRALQDYDLLLSKDYGPRGENVSALTGRGLTFERMGDFGKAKFEFEKVVASKNVSDHDVTRISRETAVARLAALNAGISQPLIAASAPRPSSPTSIPTLNTSVSAPEVSKQTGLPVGRRVALVIGNSSYKSVPELTNPQKDAEAVAASLRNIGFETVTLAADATREKLIDALRAFANEAEKSDWAMVYYAGHGIEVNGQNYLIPVDAKLAADRDVQFEAVPLDQVLAALEGAKKLKLVLLDACRDNPFAPQMRKTAAPEVMAAASTAGGKVGTRSIGRGLGEVKVQGASLVVFAAKHGQTALDGEGANSPFAVAMVQRIATPGVEINKIFRLVRDDVMEATAGRQEPYTYGSLPGKEDFFFVAAK